MTDSVIVIDSFGKITLINRSAQELFEIKISDTFNQRLVNLIRDHELQSLITKTLKINHILIVYFQKPLTFFAKKSFCNVLISLVVQY